MGGLICWVRKERRPYFYKLVRVSPAASLTEIKEPYKVKALEYNSDDGCPQHGMNGRAQLTVVGEEVEILSCHFFSRQLYSASYNAHAIREQLAAAQQAAHWPQNHHHGHHH